MARVRTIKSVESDMEKIQSELAKLQDRFDVLTGRLSELRREKCELEAKQIITAYERSDKSLEEVLTFLEV